MPKLIGQISTNQTPHSHFGSGRSWRERNRQFAHLESLEKAEGTPRRTHAGIRKLADDYAASKGMKINHELGDVKANPEFASQIAQAYDEMKHNPNDPQVKAAYDALIGETTDQLNHLQRNGLRFSKIQHGQDNPYKSSKDLLNDLHQNGHVWYYPTHSGFGGDAEGSGASHDHPLLREVTTESGEKMPANDAFRIVHDVFGHGKEGHGFGANGEEAAYQHHMQMFSPLAQKALTSETRGQNSWVNFGPHGEHNRKNPSKTIYADQKAGLLPDWATKTPAQTPAIPKAPALPKAEKSLTKSVDSVFEALKKSAPLEKRSKNVREQTRNITPEQAQSRRETYARKIGLEPTKNMPTRNGLPNITGNQIPSDKSNVPIDHEMAHAMMTPKGKNIGSYTSELSDNITNDEQSKTDENVANQLGHRIDRRAGVGIGQKGGKQMPHVDGQRTFTNTPTWNNEIRDRWLRLRSLVAWPNDNRESAKQLNSAFGSEAKAHAEKFDNGARFNEKGEVVEPTGTNAKINARAAKKSAPKAAQPLDKAFRSGSKWSPERTDKDGLPHPEDPKYHKATLPNGDAIWDLKPEHKVAEDNLVQALHHKYTNRVKLTPEVSDELSKLTRTVLSDKFRHLKGTTENEPNHGLRTRHLKGLFNERPGDDEYSVTQHPEGGLVISAARHSKNESNDRGREVSSWRVRGGKVLSRSHQSAPADMAGSGGGSSFDPGAGVERGGAFSRRKAESDRQAALVNRKADDEAAAQALAITAPKSEVQRVGTGVVKRKKA